MQPKVWTLDYKLTVSESPRLVVCFSLSFSLTLPGPFAWICWASKSFWRTSWAPLMASNDLLYPHCVSNVVELDPTHGPRLALNALLYHHSVLKVVDLEPNDGPRLCPPPRCVPCTHRACQTRHPLSRHCLSRSLDASWSLQRRYGPVPPKHRNPQQFSPDIETEHKVAEQTGKVWRIIRKIKIKK